MPAKLPIGIQTFDELIGNDYLYVDKTRQIHKLLSSGKYFFLSRPRRFGKSLTLSTINAIFNGRKQLFTGLWIESNWDWNMIHSQIFMSEAEAYYHSLIYLVFFYLGQYTESEVNTSDGRLDCVVHSPTHIYVLEFKLDQSAENALQQIKDRGYAEKYTADPRPKVLLGINFGREQKTVEGWVAETVE